MNEQTVNNECFHHAIARILENAAKEIYELHGHKWSLPDYLHHMIYRLAFDVYAAAPSDEDADTLIQDAFQQARNLFLKSEQSEESN